MVSTVSTVCCSDTWAQQTERYYAVRGVNVTDVILLVGRRRDRSSFGTPGGHGPWSRLLESGPIMSEPTFVIPLPKSTVMLAFK